MPLTLPEIEANVADTAAWLGLSDQQEADLRTKVREGYARYGGRGAETVAAVKRELRGEALDLMGYPCLADGQLDPTLLECARMGKRLLDVLDADLGLVAATSSVETFRKHTVKLHERG
jgi:hypothetical protein